MSQTCVIFPSSYKDVRVSSSWDRQDGCAGRARMFDEEGLTVKMIAQTLSSSERLVLSLHYGEGLTASEIADVMIDGQIRRVSLSHFEPVARDEAES